MVQGSYPFAIEIESDDQGLRLATTESDRVLSGSFRVVSDKASAAGFQEVVSIIARFEGTSGSVLRSNFDAFLTLKPAEIKAGDTLLAMGRHELRAALWVTAQEGAGQIVGSSDWVSYLTQESALVQPDVALRSGIEGNFSQNEGSFSVLLPDAQLKIRDQSIEIGAIGLAGQKDADQGEYLLAGLP